LEDGLHYSILDKVAELFFRALENKTRQFFIATHSGELIDVFIRVAQERKFDDLCVINLSGTNEITTRHFDASEAQYALELDAELR
jgi:AAA15 family ATPase/GTPase